MNSLNRWLNAKCLLFLFVLALSAPACATSTAGQVAPTPVGLLYTRTPTPTLVPTTPTPTLSAETLFQLGADQRQQWDLNAALNRFDAALALSPDARAFAGRAEIYRLMGRLGEAEADVAQALALSPDLAEAWRQKALLAQARQSWNEALTAAGEWIARQPDAGEAYVLRAHIYADGLGELEPALADYERAAALSHGWDKLTLEARWRILAALGRWDEAFLVSLKMFTTGSEDPARYYYRAWSLIQLRRLDDAIQQLLFGIQRYPDYPVALYYALGVAYFERFAWGEAITALEVALAQSGAAPAPDAPWRRLGITTADILARMGLAYLKLGQCETGGAIVQRAVAESADPTTWGWAVRQVGACYTAITPTPTLTPAPSPTPHAVQVPPTATP